MPDTRKPRQMSKDRLIPYAYHEAGHAVVGHVIGRCIKEVSIASDKKQGYQGYCEFSSFIEDANGYPRWSTNSGNPEIVTILYAGMLAMAYASIPQERFDDYIEGSEQSDLEKINQFLQQFYPDEQKSAAIRDMCWKQAQDILQNRFDAVSELAERLVEQERLTGREAHSIIRRALGETRGDWRIEG